MVLVAVYSVSASASQRHAVSADALFTLIYVQNWHQLWTGHLTPLAHTWSLSVEEQWYLVWPLVVVWFLRTRPRSRRATAVIRGDPGVRLLVGLAVLDGELRSGIRRN